MKALFLDSTGGVENLHLRKIQKPLVHKHEVLIEVKALSINPVDVKVREDDELLKMITSKEPPEILGWDIAGVVTDRGRDVDQFKIGDRVFGMINFPGEGKGYAEFVACSSGQIAKIPDDVSFEEAAATTLAALTALQTLNISQVKKNDKVLIHAGSGGVGHFAIQIAKYLGAKVIATSSSAHKDLILNLGADRHLDYKKCDFEKELADVDFILDTIGGETLEKSVRIAAPGGKIITLISPDIPVSVATEAEKNNVNLRFYMVRSNGNDMKTLSRLLKQKKVKPHIFKIFKFEEIADAHKQIETHHTVGKVIIKM